MEATTFRCAIRTAIGNFAVIQFLSQFLTYGQLGSWKRLYIGITMELVVELVKNNQDVRKTKVEKGPILLAKKPYSLRMSTVMLVNLH